MRLFGTSGIRGVVDREFILQAYRIGLAAGHLYGNVVLGSDTRTSGPVMKSALVAGLLASGARCDDAGIVPTPTLALAARSYSAGVMITASHNPPEYNGVKLWNPDGTSFTLSQQQPIEEMVVADSVNAVAWEEMKSPGFYPGAVAQHTERIRKDFPGKYKLKVVVDAGCGAASLVTPGLLQEMGCEVITLNCYPSGFFPRGSEPVAANLEHLMQAVSESGADIGIAHDGDADRMMAIDDRGRFVPGDKLLVILARAAKAKTVVTTVDASMSIEEAGYIVRRTEVGDTYVSAELKEGGGQFGGEPSGSWIFPGISFCPDGIYAAAQIAAITSRQGKISELVDAVPGYPMRRGSIANNGFTGEKLETVLRDLQPLSVDKADGVKLNFNDGWLLVRVSGTEPKIRLTAEARTEKRLEEIYNSGLDALRDDREAGE